MQKAIINRVELQKVEVHEINDSQTRIELALSLNNRIEEIEKITQNSEENILTSIGLATLEAIRILIPRPLECQIDYVKRVDKKPTTTVQCLLRLKESGKETFLSGSAVISNSLYESAVNSMLDALGRTLERLIELQQKREQIGRSGSLTLDESTMAVAKELLEKRTERALESVNLDKSVNLINSDNLDNLNKSDNPDKSDNQITNTTRARELYEQGESFLRKGSYKQASSLLKQAVSLAPNDAEYYCQLGIALFNINAYEEAETAFLKAIELNSEVADYQTETGLFYKEIGRIDKSQKFLEKAIELDTSNARAKRALTSIHELICTFEPTKVSSGKISNSVKLAELKDSIKESSKNKPTNRLTELISQPLTTKTILRGVGLILALFSVITATIYLYSYWSITSRLKLSEVDLTQPNYIAIKIVQNFPSTTAGLSIKESVDKYLKEQKISAHNWVGVKENKTSNYVVIVTFTKNGVEQDAFWVVDLEKKICTPSNNLAKQFSSN